MPESAAKGHPSGGKSSANAISQIVQMNPRRVTITLTLPITNEPERPVITLEWGREDTNMPLSELLQRIEAYIHEFGAE